MTRMRLIKNRLISFATGRELIKARPNYLNYLITLITLFSFYSCSSGPGKNDDDATSGNIKIAVAEEYEPLINTEVDTFMKLYRYSKINAEYKSETEAFNDLINDSVRLVVASRTLNEDEKKYFAKINLEPRITKVAIDAVALIVHEDNSDTLMKYEQARDLFTGKVKSWKELNPKSTLDSIIIVFDHVGSGNVRYLKETFLKDQPLPANCFATTSNGEVIEYVKAHKNAIGVIGVNWISDNESEEANNFLKNIHVVSLSPPVNAPYSDGYYKPFPYYTALKQYPLVRDVYIVSREARAGLGTGFASFMAGDAGQRIVRLKGMLPATIPVRVISN
jgi:phosphate transport system substrate-binding protein